VNDVSFIVSRAPEPEYGLRQILVLPAGPNAEGSHRRLGADVFKQNFEASLGLKIAPRWMEMQHADHDRAGTVAEIAGGAM
jgi:hypothetical protein